MEADAGQFIYEITSDDYRPQRGWLEECTTCAVISQALLIGNPCSETATSWKIARRPYPHSFFLYVFGLIKHTHKKCINRTLFVAFCIDSSRDESKLCSLKWSSRDPADITLETISSLTSAREATQ